MNLWLILGITSYLSYAISTCIDKYMMNLRYGIIITNLIKAIFNGSILVIIGLIFFQLDFSGNISVICFIPGIIYAYSSVIYYIALRKKDVGQIIPLYQSLGILFIFISSIIVFNEYLDGSDYLGVFLILIGVYLVLSEKKLSIPNIDKASLLILILIPTDIISALIVKNLLFDVKPINLAIIMYFSAALFLFSFQFLFRKKITFEVSNIKKRVPKILSASVFGALGTLFLFLALFYGNASKVYPLAGLTSVFIFIIASFFLKEKFYVHRLCGIIIAFFGIYFIS